MKNRDYSYQASPLFVSSGHNYLLLFIIWPFLAFISAMSNYEQKESKKVVYLFLIYFGLSFVVGHVGSDAEGYAFRLSQYSLLPFSDFFEVVGGLYSDTTVDIIEPLVSFTVSRFTSFHGVAFGVWAAIFGFFYLKTINMLYERYKQKPSWDGLIFLIFFTVIMPITTISGVRMYVAGWIFFYGAYHVIIYRDKRFILVALSASLLHFSYLTANAILLIYFFAGNRNIIYSILAIISFAVPQVAFPVFTAVSLKLGGTLQSRFDSYSSENYINLIRATWEDASWFLKLSTDLIFYYLIFAIVIIRITTSKAESDKSERNVFSFSLLFLSFVNFGMGIPSFGERFQIIFLLFATLYVFLNFQRTSGRNLSFLSWVGLFPMLLYTLVEFRQGSDGINMWLFSPGLGMPFLAPAVSVADVLFY